MRYSRRQKNEAEGIDISPLIDIVFILLIFFMVSTTFVKDMKLDIERPNAMSAERAEAKSIRVSIDKRGAIILDNSEVEPWMLQSKVRGLLQGDRERPVLVITDRGVPAERLVLVVDQCRLAGATHVGVATDVEAS